MILRPKAMVESCQVERTEVPKREYFNQDDKWKAVSLKRVQKGGKTNMVMQLFRIIMCAPQTPESDRVFLTKLHVFKKPGRAALGVSWCGGQTIGTIFCQYEWAGRMALILELILGWFRNIFLKLLGLFPLENFLCVPLPRPLPSAWPWGWKGAARGKGCLFRRFEGRFHLWTYDIFIEFHTYILGLKDLGHTQPSCSAKLDCFTSLSFGSAFSLE